MLEPPVDGPLQVVYVFLVLAHALARRIGYLGYVLAIASGHLHDDVQRLGVGVVGNIGADAKGNLGLALEVAGNLVGLGKVQRIGEQQRLAGGIDAEPRVVVDELVTPEERVAGVVADAAEQGGQGLVEVAQEAVGGDGVCQGDAVVDAVFLYPGLEGDLVGVGGIVEVVALAHAHNPFMGHRADRLDAELLRQIDVGGADKVGAQHIVAVEVSELLDGIFLGLSAKPAAQAKFGEDGQPVVPGPQHIGLLARAFLGIGNQCLVVGAEAVVDFIHDGQRGDLIHGGVEQRSLGFDGQAAISGGLDGEVGKVWPPEAQVIDVGLLEPFDAGEVGKLLFGEAQRAVGFDLGFDLFDHGRGELHVLIAAFERPGGFVFAGLMEDGLPHAELVEIGFEQ